MAGSPGGESGPLRTATAQDRGAGDPVSKSSLTPATLHARGVAKLGNSPGSAPWGTFPHRGLTWRPQQHIHLCCQHALRIGANHLAPSHLNHLRYKMNGLNQRVLHAPLASRNWAGTGTRRHVGSQGPLEFGDPTIPGCPPLEATPSSACQSGSSYRHS